MKKEIFCTCILSVLSCSAQATTCTIPPTCTSLGYTQSASDCEGKNTIRCPNELSSILWGHNRRFNYFSGQNPLCRPHGQFNIQSE